MSDSALTFAELPLNHALKAAVAAMGLTVPTPIQARCVPILVQGHDLLGQSQTGSGKTFAYGLPLLHGLEPDHRDRGLQALVLCPTRELATQVTAELRKAAKGLAGVRILEVCGGQQGWSQRQSLEQGVHIVVGTPGRCLDLLQRGVMSSARIRMVVLDEADRMLDLGFQDQVERILEGLPDDRQTVFFSATFPVSIAAMSARWQRDPVRVTVTGEPLEIRHLAHVAEAEGRGDALLAVLSARQPGSAIVFGNFKESVKRVAGTLAEAGFSVGELHGDLDQVDRDRVMARLRNGSVRILVATDVAARGIDVAGLDLVVNYELPAKADAYVHRTGRTGRAGQPGLAITLVSSRERERLGRIAAELGLDIPLEPLPEGVTTAPPVARMTTLFIGGGRKNKLRPGDILGALTGPPEKGGGGLPGAEIGKIEIHDRFAYVAVSETIAERALLALRDGRIKGTRFKVEAVRG
ncbi:MAG: ATP-dependent RNA helicase DbpA [Myxococcales bacterium]|nr:ATP-dependent RNA helicase DbpA [Myxococcales bacterium]